MATVIRSIYDGQQDIVSQASGLDCSKDKGRTKQSMKDECDINKITARYERTGALPDMIREDPQYGDFSDVPSFQEALHLVSLAETQFGALDARVRARFENDPAQFLAFATDPANLGEMVKLGLAVERPSPTPSPAASSAPGDPASGGAVKA